MRKLKKFICGFCNKEFYRQDKIAVTCNRECRNKNLSKKRKGIAPVYKNPEERALKISKALKGKLKSEEHKNKLRITHSEKWIKNWLESRLKKNNFKHTKEWCNNHSLRMLGKNNPSWKGGKSFEPYSLTWTNRLKKTIRERDNHICKLCEQKENGQKHEVHHIDYDKQNNVLNNLITLCKSCHMKTNYNRSMWTERFSII